VTASISARGFILAFQHSQLINGRRSGFQAAFTPNFSGKSSTAPLLQGLMTYVTGVMLSFHISKKDGRHEVSIASKTSTFGGLISRPRLLSGLSLLWSGITSSNRCLNPRGSLMRSLNVALIILLCTGCGKFKKEETERKPLAPTGIASTEDVSNVQQAVDGTGPSARNSTQQTTAVPPVPTNNTQAAPVPTNNTQAAPPSANKTQAAPDPSIIGKTTAKVVDAKEALKNPKIVVVENKISGSDPLTIAASAYVSLSSRVSVLNFKNQLNIIKATEGRYPTFAEYQKLAQQLRIEFTRLPPWQAYGYDSTAGGLVILEDKAAKIARYKKAGIPIEEADKRYE
jgi:hypothetical protein